MSWLYAISLIGFVSVVVRSLIAAGSTPCTARRSRRTTWLGAPTE